MTELDHTIASVLNLFTLGERLKREGRHCWYPDGRRESVAEHTWRVSLMAFVLYRSLKRPVNIERVLKMIIIHDLAEAEIGDTPVHDQSDRNATKFEAEKAVIDRLKTDLDCVVGDEIHELWHEYEAQTSAEARFVKALDRLEAQLSHNEADLSSWTDGDFKMLLNEVDHKLCQSEPVLNGLYKEIAKASLQKVAGSTLIQLSK